MYKAATRALLRHSIRKLNEGDYSLTLRMAHPDFELIFPGDNSWARMFTEPNPGREPHVTHRGIEQGIAFAERFVSNRVQLVVEDILVNGPPWNTRIALRAHDYIVGPDGADEYNNRYVGFLELRWARLLRWEVYEDTERTAAWDDAQAGAASV